MKWDAAYLKGLATDLGELRRRAEDYLTNNPDSAVLLSMPLRDARKACLCFRTSGTAFAHPDEVYYLYRRCGP